MAFFKVFLYIWLLPLNLPPDPLCEHPLSLPMQQAEQGSEQTQTPSSWCLQQLQTLSLPCPGVAFCFPAAAAHAGDLGEFSVPPSCGFVFFFGVLLWFLSFSHLCHRSHHMQSPARISPPLVLSVLVFGTHPALWPRSWWSRPRGGAV